MGKFMPLAEQMERFSVPEPNTGCHLWLGYMQRDGYGALSNNRRALLAHRAAWEVAHGVPPAGKYVLHTCDVPWCVNVAHLYVGTQLDNMQDMARRKRSANSKKTHCIRGHELSGRNLYCYMNKGALARCCKACHAAAAMARKARAT